MRSRAVRRLLPAILFSLCAALAPAIAPAAVADGGVAPEALLARAAAAMAGSNWSGVYVHTAGGQSESFRTTRRIDGTSDAERVEALEGVAREIVRQGDEVHVFVPDRREVRIERRLATSGFPLVLPADPAALAQSYRVSVAGAGRVASRDAIILKLQAVDALRYSREVWLDRETALPLKLRVIDAAGATLEQVAFSEVRIGQRIPAARVRPGRQAGYAGWEVQRLTAELPGGLRAPDAASLGPGFRLLGGLARRAQGEAPPAIHWAFGDGLAAVSVFVEEPTASAGPAAPLAAQRGALGVLEITAGARRLTAVGEVPRALLERSLAAASAALR